MGGMYNIDILGKNNAEYFTIIAGDGVAAAQIDLVPVFIILVTFIRLIDKCLNIFGDLGIDGSRGLGIVRHGHNRQCDVLLLGMNGRLHLHLCGKCRSSHK